MTPREWLFNAPEDPNDPRVDFFDTPDDSPFRVFPAVRPRRDVEVLLHDRTWATIGADGSVTFVEYPALTIVRGDVASVIWHAREVLDEVAAIGRWESRVFGEPLSDGCPARWFVPPSWRDTSMRPILLQQGAREKAFTVPELPAVIDLCRLAVHVGNHAPANTNALRATA